MFNAILSLHRELNQSDVCDCFESGFFKLFFLQKFSSLRVRAEYLYLMTRFIILRFLYFVLTVLYALYDRTKQVEQ